MVAITGASGAIYGLRLVQILLQSGCEVHLTISPSGRDVLHHELGIELNLTAFDRKLFWESCVEAFRNNARFQNAEDHPETPPPAGELLKTQSWGRNEAASSVRSVPPSMVAFNADSCPDGTVATRTSSSSSILAAATEATPAEGPSSEGNRQVPAVLQEIFERFHYWPFDQFFSPIASGSFRTDGMVICPCSLTSVAAIVHGMASNLIHRAASVHLKEGRKLVVVPRETPLSEIQLENLWKAARAGIVVLPAMPGFYHHPRGVEDLVDFVVGRICDQLGVPQKLVKPWQVEGE